MQDIVCQNCTAESREEKGCGFCGGYGTVLVVRECPKCQAQSYVRPGNHTSFEGKKWYSFDGLMHVDSQTNGNSCARCNEDARPTAL